MIAGFSSMLLLSLYGSIVSHADLVGAVSLSFSGSAQLRGREISATFGTLRSPMEKVGDYILVPDTDDNGGIDRRSRKRAAPTGEDATFTVDAASSTTVELEFEVLMPTIFTDSFYVWFDDNMSPGQYIKWQPGQFTSFTWAVVGRFQLSAGAHILHVGVREEGAKLRTLRIKTGDVVFTNMPACPAGFFSDGTQICQDANCADPAKADALTGFCKAGCKAGFFSSGAPGQTCQDANCAIPANADATTGFCLCDSGGCASGFFSSVATGQICQDANCADPAKANVETGVCDAGCKAGFFSSGAPGQICQDANCADPANADAENGVCSAGCKAGFFSSGARQICQDPWTTATVHEGKVCETDLWDSPMSRTAAQRKCDSDALCKGLMLYNKAGGDPRIVELGRYKGCGGTGSHAPDNHFDIIVNPGCSDDDHCDGCVHNICSACSSGFILNVADVCVTKCPSDQYGVVGIDTKCQACGASGSIFNKAGICVDNCPSGQYEVNDLQCEDCDDDNCAFCASDKCTYCNWSYMLNKSGTCKNHCEDGQWGDRRNQCKDLPPTFNDLPPKLSFTAARDLFNACGRVKDHFLNNYSGDIDWDGQNGWCVEWHANGELSECNLNEWMQIQCIEVQRFH